MGIFDAPVESLAKAKLSKDERDSLPDSDFVFPKDRRYPIHDKRHALIALTDAAGTSDEAAVRAAVAKRYPDINLSKATMTTGDLGGAGEAPTSVSQGNAVCPSCGRSGGKHEKGCRYAGTNPSGDEVGLTKEGTPADKTPEPFSSSRTSNWVARAGGLPNYVQHVAHALVRKGEPESTAIAKAIGIIRNWAEGKGDVSPAVQAAAAKALAQWEKMKADTHVKKSEEDIVASTRLDDPDIVWAMEAALRTAVPGQLRKELFVPREEVEKRFNPREPRDKNGRWVSLGGVTGRESELAHQLVGGTMAGDQSAPPHNYRIGKKVERGEQLTRKERGIAKSHVQAALAEKSPYLMSPVARRRYQDFAKVHGMDLKTKTKTKTKTKSNHPGKQVGNPGAKKPANLLREQERKSVQALLHREDSGLVGAKKRLDRQDIAKELSDSALRTEWSATPDGHSLKQTLSEEIRRRGLGPG